MAIYTADQQFEIDADTHQFILRRARFNEEGEVTGYAKASYHSTVRALVNRILRDRLAAGIIHNDTSVEESIDDFLAEIAEIHQCDLADLKQALMQWRAAQ